MEWIKTADKLPDSFEKVIVTLYSGVVSLGHWSESQHKWNVYNSIKMCCIPADMVLAWMPLPIAFKEG